MGSTIEKTTTSATKTPHGYKGRFTILYSAPTGKTWFDMDVTRPERAQAIADADRALEEYINTTA